MLKLLLQILEGGIHLSLNLEWGACNYITTATIRLQYRHKRVGDGGKHVEWLIGWFSCVGETIDEGNKVDNNLLDQILETMKVFEEEISLQIKVLVLVQSYFSTNTYVFTKVI